MLCYRLSFFNHGIFFNIVISNKYVYGTLSPLLIFQIVFMVGLVVPFSICESIPLLTPVIPASSSNVSFFSCLIFFKLLPIIVLISKIVAPSVSFLSSKSLIY